MALSFNWHSILVSGPWAAILVCARWSTNTTMPGYMPCGREGTTEPYCFRDVSLFLAWGWLSQYTAPLFIAWCSILYPLTFKVIGISWSWIRAHGLPNIRSNLPISLRYGLAIAQIIHRWFILSIHIFRSWWPKNRCKQWVLVVQEQESSHHECWC